MNSISRTVFTVATGAALVAALSGPDGGLRADAPPTWAINTWPGGRIPYRFATAADNARDGTAAVLMNATTKDLVRAQMRIWERAVSSPDPADLARRESIDLYDGGSDCPESQANTIRHKLGHCLGLWHEQNRADRDAWLEETPEADTNADWKSVFEVSPKGPALIPLLANYDYNSIMHYKSRGKSNVLRWTDALGNEFSRGQHTGVSSRDVSRVLQYYARQASPRWGFFESLAAGSADSDVRPDPLLAPDVASVGTPAVAWQSEGSFDIFARGSNQRISWKSFRRRVVAGVVIDSRRAWTSLGCCFASDPSAVSPAVGHVCRRARFVWPSPPMTTSSTNRS